MNGNKNDIFELNKIKTQKLENKSGKNFFENSSAPSGFVSNMEIPENFRRLNDYDFNLLKEDAYKDIDDDIFKLEYKISKAEEEINNLEFQLQSAKDIDDVNLVYDIEKRLKVAKEDYEALIAIYNNKSFSGKITDIVKTKIDTKFSGIKNNILNISEKIVEKLPAPFSKIFELKKSLTKLENINKSVDELMRLNIPYGENINKYEQLSRYIIKAYSIQSEISNYIKKS